LDKPQKPKRNEKKKIQCYENPSYEKSALAHTPWAMQSDVEGSMESTDFYFCIFAKHTSFLNDEN
jgi:hypothetical protein